MKNPQDHSSHSISRRKFIGSSSLAGLSVLTFPNAARGTSANEKLRFACIGAGGRASSAFGTALNEHLVAIAEPDPDGRGAGRIKKAKAAGVKFTFGTNCTTFRVVCEENTIF